MPARRGPSTRGPSSRPTRHGCHATSPARSGSTRRAASSPTARPRAPRRSWSRAVIGSPAARASAPAAGMPHGSRPTARSSRTDGSDWKRTENRRSATSSSPSPRPSFSIPGTSGGCAARAPTTSPSTTSSFPRSARCCPPRPPPLETGPLYRIPRTLLFASGDAAASLGVARACLDAFFELAGVKTPRAMPGLLRDQPMVQADIGRAEAHLGSGRAFLTETVRDVWADVSATNTISLDQRAALRLATTHAIRLAVQVVDTAYNAAGATAVYESHLLQRHFQDIHVISQHLQGRLSHYELVGRHWLGLPVDETRL